MEIGVPKFRVQLGRFIKIRDCVFNILFRVKCDPASVASIRTLWVEIDSSMVILEGEDIVIVLAPNKCAVVVGGKIARISFDPPGIRLYVCLALRFQVRLIAISWSPLARNLPPCSVNRIARTRLGRVLEVMTIRRCRGRAVTDDRSRRIGSGLLRATFFGQSGFPETPHLWEYTSLHAPATKIEANKENAEQISFYVLSFIVC